MPDEWTAKSVSLTPTDAGGSGVAATYYTIGGVQQTYTAPFAVSAAGSHAITYWSTDAAGNEETHHTGYVNIDTGKPTSQAAKNVTVKKGSYSWSVRATDIAGNTGNASAAKKLIVK
jgi:hypothetical protein